MSTPVVIFLTSGTTWVVPSDWNNANNAGYGIAGGNAGNIGNAGDGAGGGGSGGYADAANMTLTGSINFQVGSALVNCIKENLGDTGRIVARLRAVAADLAAGTARLTLR